MRSGDSPSLPDSLGAALRRLRVEAGCSARSVAQDLGWSASKLSRIETSRSGVKPSDLSLLLDRYRLDGDVRDRINDLARRMRQEPRTMAAALPPAYLEYADLEGDAAHISMYGAIVVPGLLQTPEYAFAVIAATPMPEEHHARVRMDRRLLRQKIFARRPPVRLSVILDEAVLRRPIGGKDIMQGQMIRLRELSIRPETTIRVLPFKVGAHPALTGQFAILDFSDDPTPARVFCDGLTGGVLREGSLEVNRYRACFVALAELALSVDESAEVIATLAEDPTHFSAATAQESSGMSEGKQRFNERRAPRRLGGMAKKQP